MIDAGTPTSALMDTLSGARERVLWQGVEGAVQSTAGFASLHVAITLLVALMVQYTVRSRIVHWAFWANFVITVVATIYFGWHYIADDVAGILIALLAFYLGGRASGQVFERHGLASHPTTDSSAVPVDADRLTPAAIRDLRTTCCSSQVDTPVTPRILGNVWLL